MMLNMQRKGDDESAQMVGFQSPPKKTADHYSQGEWHVPRRPQRDGVRGEAAPFLFFPLPQSQSSSTSEPPCLLLRSLLVILCQGSLQRLVRPWGLFLGWDGFICSLRKRAQWTDLKDSHAYIPALSLGPGGGGDNDDDDAEEDDDHDQTMPRTARHSPAPTPASRRSKGRGHRRWYGLLFGFGCDARGVRGCHWALTGARRSSKTSSS